MLQLITGIGGSGKTYTMVERIGKLLEDDPAANPILLVPEQFSLETEKLLLARLAPTDLMRVKVYSFTRYSEMLLRESGRTPKTPLNEGTRLLLLNQALKETEGQRTLPFREGDAGQLKLLLDVMKEWKQNAVSSDKIQEIRSKLKNPLLSDKLQDLEVIRDAFDNLVSTRFDDPQDLLSQAYDKLREGKVDYSKTELFLDGFMGFTVQEEQLISYWIEHAASVTVSLCNDPVSTRDSRLTLFMLPAETGARLKGMARACGSDVKLCALTDDRRHPDGPLQALCNGIFRADAEDHADETETDAVTVISCVDKSEEGKAVARAIRRYLREEGGRCRDVAVVTRDVGAYRGALETALQSEEIPYYLDERESIRGDALVETICAALKAALYGFCTEDVLRLLKTGMTGVSVSDTAKLENYVYQWSVGRLSPATPFSEHPDGFGKEWDDKEKTRLEELNALRETILRPLDTLKKALNGQVDGLTFASAVYTYLKDVEASKHTKQRIRLLDESGQSLLGDRADDVWEATMRLLDTFAAGGIQEQSALAWANLFSMAAQATDLGVLPKGIDAVQVGGADRIRLSAPKRVFLVGANEGVFPGVPSSGGFLSARERKALQSLDLRLSKDMERELTEERLYAYNAVAAATEGVTVTYSRKGMDGKELAPSALVTEIEKILPHAAKTTFHTGADDLPETPREAMTYYTETYRRRTPLTGAVEAVLEEDPLRAPRLHSLQKMAEKQPWAFADPAVAETLFGRNLTVSASAVEKYYSCPFRYFCDYGLQISDRQKAELDPLNAGHVIHDMMEKLVPAYVKQGFDTVTEEQVKEDTAKAVDAYVETQMGGTGEKPKRFTYLVKQLKESGNVVMWHLVRELRQSRFVPTDFELKIGEGEAIPPLTVKLKDGSEVNIIGKIDRVDVFTDENGETFIRIVDYKTGQKTLNINDVVNGMNLQMVLYLFAVIADSKRYAEHPQPAGILYLPAGMPRVNYAGTAEDTAAAMDAEMKMKGLVLARNFVVRAMEEEAKGVFIPAYIKEDAADGTPEEELKKFDGNRCSVSSLDQFAYLRHRMEVLLENMALSLRAGEIAALPNKKKAACSYCDYAAVCGFETGDDVRAFDFFKGLANKRNKGLLEILEKNGGEPVPAEETPENG